jgi:hypothetical protein
MRTMISTKSQVGMCHLPAQNVPQPGTSETPREAGMSPPWPSSGVAPTC